MGVVDIISGARVCDVRVVIAWYCIMAHDFSLAKNYFGVDPHHFFLVEDFLCGDPHYFSLVEFVLCGSYFW